MKKNHYRSILLIIFIIINEPIIISPRAVQHEDEHFIIRSWSMFEHRNFAHEYFINPHWSGFEHHSFAHHRYWLLLNTIILLIIGIDYFWTSQPPPSRHIGHFWMSCFHWWTYIDLHDGYFHDNLHQSKCWSPIDRRGEHVQHVSNTRVAQKLRWNWLFLNQPSSTFIILMEIIQIICGYMALILQGPWIFMIIC